MGHRRAASAVAAVMSALALVGAPDASAAVDRPGSPGSVRFMRATTPEFDEYTANATWASWLDARFWRMRTYTPYFDHKTSWFDRAWVYRDLYGLGIDYQVAREHPEWIMRDAAGRRLYIPWGCSNGSCPLYAADIANPAFRAWWIDEARDTLSHGYKGLHIDDVNLEFRVGDGSGEHVTPIDTRTGAAMTYPGWRDAMADFLEQIRAAFPDVEIVHNVIWYAPEDDPNVARALRAADYINLERGANDSGITYGDHRFGYERFLAFIDHRHAHGAGVVFDSYATDRDECEYGLATYFLTNDGHDAYSGATGATPRDFWDGWKVELGDARGPRYEWHGLFRRDFEGGVVLVNQPQAETVTIDLGGSLTELDGRTVSSVTLGPARAAVLRFHGAAATPLPPRATAAAQAASAPARSEAPPRTAAASAAPARPTACRGTAARARRSRVGLRVTVGSGRRKRATVCGTARGATRGKAGVRLYRRTATGWSLVRQASAAIDRRGRFRAVFAGLAPGRYRAAAEVRRPRAARAAAVLKR